MEGRLGDLSAFCALLFSAVEDKRVFQPLSFKHNQPATFCHSDGRGGFFSAGLFLTLGVPCGGSHTLDSLFDLAKQRQVDRGEEPMKIYDLNAVLALKFSDDADVDQSSSSRGARQPYNVNLPPMLTVEDAALFQLKSAVFCRPTASGSGDAHFFALCQRRER